MTRREKAFCLNLKKGMNITDAVIAAGYKATRAASTGYELMKKPDVRDYLAIIDERIEQKNIADIQERQELLTQIMREEAVGDKLKAVDLLNKMTNVYVTRIEGDVETVIRVELED